MSYPTNTAAIANQLPASLEIPDTYEEAQEILSLMFKRIVDVVNTKEGSLYTLQELINFKQYYDLTNTQVFKNVYRYVYDFVNLNGGPIAAGATVSFPHNILMPVTTSALNGVQIYGSATNSDTMPNGPHRMPVPYSSETATRNIEIYFDDVNVTLINGSTQTALTYCSIVLEYIKN